MDSQLEQLRTELGRALAGLSVTETQLRPGGDESRWTAQQIAGHMGLTYAATCAAMEARIVRGTPTKARASLTQLVAQAVVVRMGRFPAGRVAPDVVVPGPCAAACGDAIAAAIGAEIVRMNGLIDAVQELFGEEQRCVSHMVLGPMNVDQWRRFHLIHGRHHIRQIQSIRREYGV